MTNTEPAKKLTGSGLRGQSAGQTALCTVGKEGTGLTYCGYDIADLAENTCFEEVAYLLLYGALPTIADLDAYRQRIASMRGLPLPLREILERIPADAHPMDVMRTGCSALGNLEPEGDFSNQQRSADRLLAALPGIICYWYRFTHDGVRIDTETGAVGTGAHFLQMLHGRPASELHSRAMDVSLILYAEHEFNASTFTARVCASTLSDLYSCVTGAIGSLRGPLHGGANEAAMEMIEKFKSVEEAAAGIRAMLARKEKIMGFGHAIYHESDPRNAIIKNWSAALAKETGDKVLYPISCVVEEVMRDEKNLFANADFFHASTYRFLAVPTKLFTPIFVCSRVSGWAAHVMEQRDNNRIIRPSADYVGPAPRPVPAIEER